jgi:hypothetical protein
MQGEVRTDLRPWLWQYPSKLVELRDNPLGWHFQAMFRRGLYAQISVLTTMIDLIASIQEFSDSNVVYTPSEKLEYISRGLELILRQPIVTLTSLRDNDFDLWELGIADFYREAFLEFNGDLPTAERIFNAPEDEWHVNVKLRPDVTKEEQMSVVGKLLENERVSRYGETRRQTVRSLCSSGALQFVDLGLYDIMHDLSLTPAVTANLVFGGERKIRKELSATGLRAFGVRSSRSLGSTRHNAEMFLNEDLQPALNLRRSAIKMLLKGWKKNGGRGDDKFTLSVDESRRLTEGSPAD